MGLLYIGLTLNLASEEENGRVSACDRENETNCKRLKAQRVKCWVKGRDQRPTGYAGYTLGPIKAAIINQTGKN